MAAFLLVAHLVLFFLYQPSHNRDWELGQEKLPRVIFSATSSLVTIDNYRNFKWTGPKEAEVNYEIQTFDLDKLQTVDFFISHFSDFEGLAHVFLSFGFNDGKHVVVSLETRREKGEEFSPLLGVLRQYEIIYVVGSENDVVGVRTGPRDERVYLYGSKITAEQAKNIFGELARKINDIYEHPRVYNTLTHNCVNELTRAIEKTTGIKFPLTWKMIFAGYFDEVLYDMGLINNSADFATVKRQHLLDNSKLNEQSETYSADIRRQIEETNKKLTD